MEESQPEEEEPLVVPRVKVAEDGSLIIDEERSVTLYPPELLGNEFQNLVNSF